MPACTRGRHYRRYTIDMTRNTYILPYTPAHKECTMRGQACCGDGGAQARSGRGSPAKGGTSKCMTAASCTLRIPTMHMTDDGRLNQAHCTYNDYDGITCWNESLTPDTQSYSQTRLQTHLGTGNCKSKLDNRKNCLAMQTLHIKSHR